MFVVVILLIMVFMLMFMENGAICPVFIAMMDMIMLVFEGMGMAAGNRGALSLHLP
jgi:hypothetical protein